MASRVSDYRRPLAYFPGTDAELLGQTASNLREGIHESRTKQQSLRSLTIEYTGGFIPKLKFPLFCK